MSDHLRISRREFIKDAAIASAAVAATGMLGPANASAAQIPTKWDKETDVIVVGSGCGLAAAIEAKTAGADVIVVEKADHVGGLFLSAGGGCTMGGNNVVQQRDGVKDDDEQWYQDEMYASDYRAVPEIIRTLVKRGPDTVKWMQDLGIEWAPIGAGVLRPPVKRGLQPVKSTNYPGKFGTDAFGSGISWTTVMKRKVDALGVPILLNHRMTRLHRNGTGPVVGIEVKNQSGTINIKARKAVILCTGTWTDNARMVQAWDPRIVGQDTYGDGGVPGYPLYTDSAGDGHLAAAEVGAGFSDMSFVSFLNIFYGTRAYWVWEPRDWTRIPENYFIQSMQPLLSGEGFRRVILVKSDGARWVNETLGGATYPAGHGGYAENPENPYSAAYLSLPQPRNVWAVTDSEGAEALKWPVADFRNPQPLSGRGLDPTCVAVADTLADLATKVGIDAAKLQATITKYNGFVDAGKDNDFGKPMPMYKLTKPPFYAAKASLIRHTQRNGVRVNTKSQIIDQLDQRYGLKPVSIDQEKVIPHLYAAGEVGNIVGWRRPHNTLGHYITAARIAGENGAKETPAPSV